MLDAISFSQSQKKPVVACCDLCASACYYVACHCNKIIADNDISAEFGSIGVMMQFPDYAKYYEKQGIKVHTIYSDLSTHKNAPFEAALKGEYKSIKEEMLNPLAREFQQAVKSHRPNLDDKVDGILNGRMFFAKDALKYGLIDAIGNRDAATEEVRRLAASMSLEEYAANL
jgi:protease-4